MQYPGRIIKEGEQDAGVVQTVKRRLNEALGLDGDPSVKLDASNPSFGPTTTQAVKLFQTRNVDSAGRPLKQDGSIGALTWDALFGSDTVPRSNVSADPYLVRVLQVAAGEEARHVREVPPNSNRGADVEAYLRRVGVAAGLSWCCAFVYWCFDEAAKAMNRANPMVRTAGCMDHWRRAPSKGAKCIPVAKATENPALVKSGMILIIDHGGGLGHTGFVESVTGGLIATIEGNTDASKTREGGGVYRLTRKIVDISEGFIDYSGV